MSVQNTEYSRHLVFESVHVVLGGEEFCSLRHCAIRREVPGSIPPRVVGSFQVTCIPSVPGVHSEMSTKEFPGHSTDTSAVQVAPNVKIWLQAQHSIKPPSLQDLVREGLTVTTSLVFDLNSALFSVISVYIMKKTVKLLANSEENAMQI